tara:strand:- start:303 stop:776 length:474 start_codon:yes stop_codon:yes gene_type:complete
LDDRRDYKQFAMKNFKQFFIEKQLFGLIEFFDIDGVGKVPAKLDSGNGAYNVLHGEDIQIQGDKVFFRTVNNKTLLKDKKGEITINVGAGNTEDRPIVEFDFTIGEQEFTGIPFTLSDRATNLYKILVGKDFIVDQLDGIIDPDRENIAYSNVECEV